MPVLKDFLFIISWVTLGRPSLSPSIVSHIRNYIKEEMYSVHVHNHFMRQAPISSFGISSFLWLELVSNKMIVWTLFFVLTGSLMHPFILCHFVYKLKNESWCIKSDPVNSKNSTFLLFLSILMYYMATTLPNLKWPM